MKNITYFLILLVVLLVSSNSLLVGRNGVARAQAAPSESQNPSANVSKNEVDGREKQATPTTSPSTSKADQDNARRFVSFASAFDIAFRKRHQEYEADPKRKEFASSTNMVSSTKLEDPSTADVKRTDSLLNPIACLVNIPFTSTTDFNTPGARSSKFDTGRIVFTFYPAGDSWTLADVNEEVEEDVIAPELTGTSKPEHKSRIIPLKGWEPAERAYADVKAK